MRKTVDILGIPIDFVTMDQAVQNIRDFLAEDRVHTIYTPNAEIIMEAQSLPDLHRILKEGDMVIADGAGVVLASKMLGTPLPAKVSGVDLCRNAMAAEMPRKIRYFLFGSKPGVAETAAQNLVKTYPDIEIAGYLNGYFTAQDEDSIVETINHSRCDILLVALGVPKQEQWIDRNKHRLNARICIGVGGSLDIYAGTVKLAPDFYRNHGLEWLYRLCQQPWRYKRMLKLPQFILRVAAKRLKLH